MQWNRRKMLVTVAILAMLWDAMVEVEGSENPPSDSQQPTAYLRWKNGDVLGGKLLESKPGKVHWASIIRFTILTLLVARKQWQREHRPWMR